MKTVQEQLLGTTLMSDITTHKRIKHLGLLFGISEDHISRIAMAMSIREGQVPRKWKPSELSNDLPLDIVTGKSLRGKTLFKEDLPMWMALIGEEVNASDYPEFREVFLKHWGRGVEMMYELDHGDDWLNLLHRVVEA